jgi:uncharacterized protein (TIGR02246 family)
MRVRLSLAAALVLLAIAPARAETAAGAQVVDAAWLAAMKANDVDAVVRCYARDAVVWLPNAPVARGEKEIRALYEGLLTANTVKDAALTNVTYRTLGAASLAWGTFALTLAPKSGGDPIVMTGRFTEVAERRGDRWVYIVDHASADPAPPK